MIKIAPSILAANFSVLKEQIEIVEMAGADWLHLDVMDGHFVPNITFGPLIVDAVKKLTDLPLDVHLMIENPDQYIQKFIDAGADIITVHAEATVHLNRTLNYIKEAGAKAGVALNPATPIHSLEYVLNDIDLVLAMSVNPGFGGQSFIPQVIEKIQQISKVIQMQKQTIALEVDGGIDTKTAPKVVKAGADVLVAGTAIFSAPDISVALKELKTSVLEKMK